MSVGRGRAAGPWSKCFVLFVRTPRQWDRAGVSPPRGSVAPAVPGLGSGPLPPRGILDTRQVTLGFSLLGGPRTSKRFAPVPLRFRVSRGDATRRVGRLVRSLVTGDDRTAAPGCTPPGALGCGAWGRGPRPSLSTYELIFQTTLQKET